MYPHSRNKDAGSCIPNNCSPRSFCPCMDPRPPTFSWVAINPLQSRPPGRYGNPRPATTTHKPVHEVPPETCHPTRYLLKRRSRIVLPQPCCPKTPASSYRVRLLSLPCQSTTCHQPVRSNPTPTPCHSIPRNSTCRIRMEPPHLHQPPMLTPGLSTPIQETNNPQRHYGRGRTHDHPLYDHPRKQND